MEEKTYSNIELAANNNSQKTNELIDYSKLSDSIATWIFRWLVNFWFFIWVIWILVLFIWLLMFDNFLKGYRF